MTPILLAALLALFATPAFAGAVRVDLYAQNGRRTGYAVVDQKSGRVDFYDVKSRRTGWGRVDSTGRVERFGLDGKRQDGMVFPITREPKGERGMP